MGSWKQLRFEINIASCIVLTGRLSGHHIVHCNRITDTLDTGEAPSFSIRPTFKIASCTAAAAGVMYEPVKKRTYSEQSAHINNTTQHLQGTRSSHLQIRKILDHLLTSAGYTSRRLNPAGATPGFICHPCVAQK